MLLLQVAFAISFEKPNRHMRNRSPPGEKYSLPRKKKYKNKRKEMRKYLYLFRRNGNFHFVRDRDNIRKSQLNRSFDCRQLLHRNITIRYPSWASVVPVHVHQICQCAHRESNFCFCKFCSVRISLLGKSFFLFFVQPIDKWNSIRRISRRKVEYFADNFTFRWFEIFVWSSILETCQFSFFFFFLSWKHFMKHLIRKIWIKTGEEESVVRPLRMRPWGKHNFCTTSKKEKIGNFAECQPRQHCHELKLCETLLKTFSNDKNNLC